MKALVLGGSLIGDLRLQEGPKLVPIPAVEEVGLALNRGNILWPLRVKKSRFDLGWWYWVHEVVP